MNVIEFGQALLDSGDLDPIYVMLNSAKQDRATTARFCLAYWMFYHAGVAARCAENEGKQFWDMVWRAQNEKWPRGTERRHFKARNSHDAIINLERSYQQPEDAVAFVAANAHWGYLSRASVYAQFADVACRAQSWRGFGPWIAFKIADMLDATLGVQVDFGKDVSIFFDDPIKGGVWVDAQRGLTFGSNAGFNDDPNDMEWLKVRWEQTPPLGRIAATERAVQHIFGSLGHMKAPHANRSIKLQEVETILCKYKSHLNGHYPVGKDTEEILHKLEGWGELATTYQTALQDALGMDG